MTHHTQATLPLSVTELRDALRHVHPAARVFVLDDDSAAIADGPAVTGLTVRGGDVYLHTVPDPAEEG